MSKGFMDMHLSVTEENSCIDAMRHERNCSRRVARTYLERCEWYIPDAIDAYDHDVFVAEVKTEEAHAVTLEAAFERIELLELQVSNLCISVQTLNEYRHDVQRELSSLAHRLSRLDGEEP